MTSPIDHRIDSDGNDSVIMSGWPYDRPEYESLAAAVQGETNRWNIPGIAVGVLHKGEIFTASTGFANLATRAPMTDDTISQIGSISKVFTTTLVMAMVDEGLLDLDTPVVTWLPDLRLADEQARETITLRHLLSHTAGFEGDRFIDYGRGEDALATAIAGFDTLRQWTAPGELWAYCNTGFYLTSRIVEVVAGEPFEDVIRKRLFEPLGLETTFFFADEAITRHHAVGHTLTDRNAGHVMAQGFSLPRYVNGTGGIICSTRELLRFAQLHLGNGKIDKTRIVSAKRAKEMQKPVTEAGDFHRNYGLGWCIMEYPEFRTYGHGGATNGFKANLTVAPDQDFAIAILTNGSFGTRAIAEIEQWAFAHYLDLIRPEPETIAMEADELAVFAGTYTRHDSTMRVAVVDDWLDLAIEPRDEETGEAKDAMSFPLLPAGERRFIVPDGLARNMAVDFIEYSGDEEPQQFIRWGGRLAVREETEPPKRKRGEKLSAKAKAIKDKQAKKPKASRLSSPKRKKKTANK